MTFVEFVQAIASDLGWTAYDAFDFDGDPIVEFLFHTKPPEKVIAIFVKKAGSYQKGLQFIKLSSIGFYLKNPSDEDRQYFRELIYKLMWRNNVTCETHFSLSPRNEIGSSTSINSIGVPEGKMIDGFEVKPVAYLEATTLKPILFEHIVATLILEKAAFFDETGDKFLHMIEEIPEETLRQLPINDPRINWS